MKTENEIVTETVDRINKGENVAIPPIVVQLIMANHQMYINAVNAQIEHLERTVTDLRAELGAIRMRINELFSGDFMPTESAIMQAVFYPGRTLMEQIKAREEATT